MAIAALLAAGTSWADVTINFSQQPADGKVAVTRLLISDATKSRSERRQLTVTDTFNVTDNRLDFKLADAPASYSLELGAGSNIGFYAVPGEDIVINVASIDPLSYSISGSELMDGIQSLTEQSSPIEAQAMALQNKKPVDKAAMEALYASYNKIFTDFIAANPESPAVAYAVMNLDGDDMIKAFESMSPAAKQSVIMPLAQMQYDNALKRAEQEKKQLAMQDGTVDAPAFALKNLEGKDVSISDFRGKWVILDFWGTWCPWCIKGFPALKEAYKQYEGKLEIIGIDCGDSEEQWRNGVARFELPWVQVYKPDSDNKVIQDYFVQGFPTKVIVNPDGKIVNITVGENPDFFTILADFINGK